jgi:hypothetical protein
MADSRASDNDERQHLALIQRLWNELQASRKDPLNTQPSPTASVENSMPSVRYRTLTIDELNEVVAY